MLSRKSDRQRLDKTRIIRSAKGDRPNQKIKAPSPAATKSFQREDGSVVFEGV